MLEEISISKSALDQNIAQETSNFPKIIHIKFILRNASFEGWRE